MGVFEFPYTAYSVGRVTGLHVCLESTDFHRHSYTLSFPNYRFEIPFSSHERPTPPDTYVHIACEPRARLLIQSIHFLRMVVDKLLGFWIIKIYREAIVIYSHAHVSQSTFLPLFFSGNDHIRLRPVDHLLKPNCQNWSPASLTSRLVSCHSPTTSSLVSFETVPRFDNRAASVNQPAWNG